MYVCMYACMYVCMYVSMYACMYVCIRIYVHTSYVIISQPMPYISSSRTHELKGFPILDNMSGINSYSASYFFLHHKRAKPSVYVSYEEEDTCVI
jgi:hypothetical protein